MTGKGGRAAAPPEVAYFRGIEEEFLARRGGPLVLSTADWHLMWKWHEAGIPLRVVLRGIADAFEGHAHSWSRDKPVRSLRYCSDEVQRAKERWRRALALQESEALDSSSAPRSLAEAWEKARLPSEFDPVREHVVATLHAGPGGEDAAAWLRSLERDVVARFSHGLGNDVMQAIRSAAEADLATYKTRIPARTFESIVRESVTRRLFERLRVPRLANW